MRFYPRKARKKTDVLVDKIASGKCDDMAISELKAAVAEISDPEELQRVSWAVLDIAMNSANLTAAGYALKALLLFMPMKEDIENALDNRVLMLVEDKAAVSNKVLIEAMAGYIRERVSGNIDRSLSFIPAMLLFLEEANGGAAAISYEVLMKAAHHHPEYFESYAPLLTRELGSINNSTRIYAAKLITKLATTHPEYMAEAEKTLLHISTFHPDAEVKSAAAEAYQTITQSQLPPLPEPSMPAQPKHDSTGGLAEIIRKKASARERSESGDGRIDNRLLSLAANFARKSDLRNGKGEAGLKSHDDSEAMEKIIDDFSEIAGVITGSADTDRKTGSAGETISKEEAELRDMVAKVQMDFSVSAESLLDSIGMKHLHKDLQTERQDDNSSTGTTETVTTTSATTMDTAMETLAAAINSDPVQMPETDVMTAGAEMSETAPTASGVIDQPEMTEMQETNMSATETSSTVPASAPEVMPEAPVTAAVPETPAEAAPSPAGSSTEIASAAPEKAPVIISKAIRSPIIPEGVRISPLKSRTPDQARKQQPPAKIFIKPHIKPLNRTPRDVSKIMQQQPQTPDGSQQTEQSLVKDPVDGNGASAAAADAQQSVESTPVEPTVCPSCGEIIAGDQQYCLKCGTDLKSLKVRCPRCSQINAKDTGTCVRCGAKLVKGPAAAKQPEIL
ncbi:zinc ribbon domain-containing protein [Methanocella arvoryzae]|uniref:DZANK-type domain-containing protein n=1 Tax=Methanocella arvoryzae (strain DSM 22066 / NBRC 105507 / MRE50) TaxID=351160 RepID=Q0W1R9_METAR|nr:zinc ribbon domain-containing protein [Methanocella arvoryzae]CAJ37674.1 hypothetical protein RCIX2626 [Methanocella arvoryzae MRE50]